MGAWADGNFDNDSALDFVADIANDVAREMAPPGGVEDIDLVMAAVAVCKTLVEHCHAPHPDRAKIESLKAEVLSMFDEQIDELEPKPDYKVGRRAAIVATFDEFLALLEK
jgi:hypothetical protein